MMRHRSQFCWLQLRSRPLALVVIAAGSMAMSAEAQIVWPGGDFACPEVWDPVCGVDGHTYSSACHAALAGVEVAHHGECGGGWVTIHHNGGHGGGGGQGGGGGGGGGYACPDVWDPVCGVDGNTYSNACYASVAGVEIAHHGACDGSGGGPVPIAGGWSGGGIAWCICPRTHYCYTPPGQCDADPVCMWRPEACLDVWNPVCGCDGNTYSNACYAAHAGVSVQYHDACSGGAIMSAPQRLPDLNGDGIVDGDDLLIVIGAMGACRGCDADLTGTGEVDALDVLLVLSAWGMTTVR